MNGADVDQVEDAAGQAARPQRLLGVAEIANRLGVRRVTVSAWQSRYAEDYPTPAPDVVIGEGNHAPAGWLPERIEDWRRWVAGRDGQADPGTITGDQDGVARLGLTVRTLRILLREEIYTVAALESLSEPDLLDLPGLGRKGAEEIKLRLGANNRALRNAK
jgi:hypothetical protein